MKKSSFDIVPMVLEDIPIAVEIHQATFPGFFLSFLGQRFLSLLYRCYVLGISEIALTGKCNGKIVSAVLGTIQPHGFYRRLATRHFIQFTLASLPPLLSNPSIIRRLTRAFFYRGDMPADFSDSALLASVCTYPEFQDKGYGTAMVTYFENEVWRRGCSRIYLVTDRIDNEPAQKFYEKLGWNVHSEFTTPEGRSMLRYWKQVGGREI